MRTLNRRGGRRGRLGRRFADWVVPSYIDAAAMNFSLWGYKDAVIINGGTRHYQLLGAAPKRMTETAYGTPVAGTFQAYEQIPTNDEVEIQEVDISVDLGAVDTTGNMSTCVGLYYANWDTMAQTWEFQQPYTTAGPTSQSDAARDQSWLGPNGGLQHRVGNFPTTATNVAGYMCNLYRLKRKINLRVGSGRMLTLSVSNASHSACSITPILHVRLKVIRVA
jgi:hypothetical protein